MGHWYNKVRLQIGHSLRLALLLVHRYSFFVFHVKLQLIRPLRGVGTEAHHAGVNIHSLLALRVSEFRHSPL